MDPRTLKPNLLKNLLVYALAFAVVISAFHFAYFPTVKGGPCDSSDFCFFTQRLNEGGAVHVRPSSAVPVDPKKSRKTIDYYISIFQDLISEGYFSLNSQSLCIDTLTGEDALALREIGVRASIGISKKATPPLIVSGEAHRLPFDENSFDFEFAGVGRLERSLRPVNFASEIARTLKPGGFFVVHTTAKDSYSFDSFLDLFNCCRLIRSREIDSLDSISSTIREIVMKKEIQILGHGERNVSPHGNSDNKCSVPWYKREIIRNAEPLIQQEPLKPWLTLKRNIKNIKYLTSTVDISFKQRYVYIDVGTRSYGSSMGSWFRKQYPKQNKAFEIYAVEADKAFHQEYRLKKGVTLLPYAAWVRNETLFFEITRYPTNKAVEKGRGMGRIQPVQSSMNHMGDGDKIQGFDFANWLKSSFSYSDFVVVKMDAEGTEFHLIPRLIETGAICLIDEFFMECHYNRWQRCCPGERSEKYEKTYAQCLELFSSLRESGVLVHQWW